MGEVSNKRGCLQTHPYGRCTNHCVDCRLQALVSVSLAGHVQGGFCTNLNVLKYFKTVITVMKWRSFNLKVLGLV